MLIWITGLSGSGKTTIGKRVYEKLKAKMLNTIFLDGDNFREILGNDLGHSPKDRLENAKRIHHELSIPMLARIPIIPGYNDTAENIAATAQFIVTELGNPFKVHLLPYHKLGETKYKRMKKPEKSISIEPPSEEHISELQKIVESFGLTTQIGG